MVNGIIQTSLVLDVSQTIQPNADLRLAVAKTANIFLYFVQLIFGFAKLPANLLRL